MLVFTNLQILNDMFPRIVKRKNVKNITTSDCHLTGIMNEGLMFTPNRNVGKIVSVVEKAQKMQSNGHIVYFFFIFKTNF